MAVYCRVVGSQYPVLSTQPKAIPDVEFEGARDKPTASTAEVRRGDGFSSGGGPRATGRDSGG